MTCRQRYELITPNAEKLIGSNDQCHDPLPDEQCKSFFEVAFAAGRHDMDFVAACLGCRLYVSYLSVSGLLGLTSMPTTAALST